MLQVRIEAPPRQQKSQVKVNTMKNTIYQV